MGGGVCLYGCVLVCVVGIRIRDYLAYALTAAGMSYFWACCGLYFVTACKVCSCVSCVSCPSSVMIWDTAALGRPSMLCIT
jgi:hypothetical protein